MSNNTIPKLEERDLTNLVRGFGTPAPIQVLEKVLEELEKERIEELKNDFNRGSREDDDRGR